MNDVRFICRWLLLCLAVFFLTACGHVSGTESDSGFSPFSAVVDFYRGPLDHFSAVRHGTCPMYPSCSAYAREALDKHGEVIGWMMAHDRLMRCGRDEIHLSPQIRVDGRLRFHDPVERNDFWWAGRKNMEPADSISLP